jgi:hypothetical protein
MVKDRALTDGSSFFLSFLGVFLFLFSRFVMHVGRCFSAILMPAKIRTFE